MPCMLGKRPQCTLILIYLFLLLCMCACMMIVPSMYPLRHKQKATDNHMPDNTNTNNSLCYCKNVQYCRCASSKPLFLYRFILPSN